MPCELECFASHEHPYRLCFASDAVEDKISINNVIKKSLVRSSNLLLRAGSIITVFLPPLILHVLKL